MTPVANSAQLVSALLSPKTNYAARSAQRQEAIQLQGVLTAQEQQKALEAQQSQAQADQFLQAAKSMSFMGRDKAKLSQHMKGEERALFETLRDNYGGDIRKFWQDQGTTWMQGAATRLQNAPFYQQASLNRQNTLLGQQAMAKGERLVGGQQGDTYQTGEQQLADFIGGKSDTYDHRGSYAPADDLKELRGALPPNALPWERTPVSEQDKLAHLVNQYGAEVGKDKFIRQHQGVPTFYRTEGLDKAIAFQRDNLRFGMEQERMQMSRQDQAMQRQAFNSSERLKGKQGQLLDAKIAEKNGSGPGGMPYDHYLLSSPSEMVPLRHDPANPKQLTTGVDLGKVKSLAGVTLYGNGDDILARQLGLQRTRDGYRGHFNEAFTTDNGVNAINLKGVSYNILGVDSKAFYNPGDLSPGADRRSPLHGYARVTLQFSPYEAEKAGLYDPNRLPFVDKDKPTSVFDSETRMGAGLFDPVSGTATLYVPAGDLRNPNFLKAMQRDEKGTKSANEDFTAPFLDTAF